MCRLRVFGLQESLSQKLYLFVRETQRDMFRNLEVQTESMMVWSRSIYAAETCLERVRKSAEMCILKHSDANQHVFARSDKSGCPFSRE